jgi:hypothetical protein
VLQIKRSRSYQISGRVPINFEINYWLEEIVSMLIFLIYIDSTKPYLHSTWPSGNINNNNNGGYPQENREGGRGGGQLADTINCQKWVFKVYLLIFTFCRLI